MIGLIYKYYRPAPLEIHSMSKQAPHFSSGSFSYIGITRGLLLKRTHLMSI